MAEKEPRKFMPRLRGWVSDWKVVKHFPRASRWVAGWGWAGCALAALGFEEAHEFGLAYALTISAAASFIFSVVYWKGLEGDSVLTKVLRVFGFILSIVLLSVGCLWITGQKGDQPLSRLPGYFLHFNARFHKQQSTPPTQSPPQPQGNQNPPGSPSPKVTAPANVSPSAIGSPEARLLMSKALIIPLKNTTTRARGFGVNFFYANRGTMPTTGQVNKGSIAVSSEALSGEDILRFMREVSSFEALPELQNGGDEIYPNDPNEHFFSMPDTDEKIAELAPFFDDVMAGKKRVYFFVTLKFRDKSMSPSVVGVSQTCGWFLQDLDVVHNCGVDRLYSEVEKPLNSRLPHAPKNPTTINLPPVVYFRDCNNCSAQTGDVQYNIDVDGKPVSMRPAQSDPTTPRR